MIVICAWEAKLCDRRIINDPSQELIPERKADVVNGARIGKCRSVLNAELQIMLATIEDRDSSPRYQSQAAFFVGMTAPESDAGSGFEVESV